MSKSSDAHKLLKELESKLDELPMHLYILIWSVSEMNTRYDQNSSNPEFHNICYPFTSVPLFNKKEGENLEGLWRTNIRGNKDLFPEPPKLKKQSGGKMSMSQAKNKMAQFGQAMNFAVQSLDPKKISPDYLYEYTTELFDTVDARLTEASGNFGLVALESTMVDPTFIIPVVPPLPIQIPGRTVLPVINAILEALRITIGIVFYVDPFGVGQLSRSLLTLIMVLLDLGRGNLYHAIFTAFGFIGTTPMFIGIVLKIMRDGVMLVSPDLRTEMRDLLFKSSKSFVLGYAIWLFTVMSPKFVKLPIQTLFDSVSLSLENINNQLDAAEIKANMSPLGKLASIRLPRIPMQMIPDVNNLYGLRDAIREPAIYCDPKIADLMEELRGVPPYALFFDLVMIPKKGSPEYIERCAPYKGGTLSDNLSAAVAPQIIPLGGDQVNPIAVMTTPQDLAKAQAPPTLPVSSTIPIAADPMSALAANPMGALSTMAGASPMQGATANPMGALASNPMGALGALASNPGALSPMAANPQGALGDMAKSQMIGMASTKLGAMGVNPGAIGAMTAMASKPGALEALAADPKGAVGNMAKTQMTAMAASKLGVTPADATALGSLGKQAVSSIKKKGTSV
jgi:hypothetical protein